MAFIMNRIQRISSISEADCKKIEQRRRAYKQTSYCSVDSTDSGILTDYEPTASRRESEIVVEDRVVLDHFYDLDISSEKLGQVKKLLRKGGWPVSHEVRQKLWTILCTDKNYDSMRTVYEHKLREETSGAPHAKVHHPVFLKDEGAVHNSFDLNEDGTMRLLRLLSMIENDHPTLTSAPFLYPLCALLLHYMSDGEAYACTEFLLRKRRFDGAKGAQNGYMDEREKWETHNAPLGFLIKSTKEWYATAHTLLALIKKHKTSTYSLLKKRCNTSDDAVMVETMRDYLQWIFRGLPLPYVVRVLDCFLVEGQKFLMRAAIAIVYIWSKMQKDVNDDRYSGMGQQERIQAVKEDLLATARQCQISPDTFIETCIRIRNLKSATIQRYQEHYEKVVANEVEERASKSLSRRPKARLFTDVFQSVIVDAEQASFIMQSLPPRLQLSTPQLLFRLSKDGASFTQLWNKVDEADQSIIIIRSVMGEVFGAYCSASWSERNDRHERMRTKYFGTGESFVFRVDKNDIADLPIIYNWVGTSGEQPDQACQMFMAAGDKYLIIGSGNGDAIRISEELSNGITNSSATFGSPPLVASTAFEIHELEVFNVSTAQ